MSENQTDILKADLEVNERDAFVKIDKFYSKLRETATGIDSLGKNSTFAAGFTRQLDEVSKKAEKTRASFAGIVRFDTNNNSLDGLSRAAIRLESETAKVKQRLADIRAVNTTGKDTGFLRILSDDAEAAERNLSRLDAQAERLAGRRETRSGGGAARAGGGGGRRGGLSEFNRALLEVTDDFAPAGFNRPFNAVGKEFLKINELSIATLGTFGAIAAAGYGIVKISQSIREEAERRLKAEELIASTVNRQILSQAQGLKDLKEARDEAQNSRDFNRTLGGSTLEDLARQKAFLERLRDITPATLPGVENGKVVSKPNEAFTKISEQLLAIDARRDDLPRINAARADASFNQRNEDFKKSQQDSIEFEKRRQAEFVKSVQKGKDKIGELQKTTESLFAGLFQSAGASNPFVAVFSEADKAIENVVLTTASLRKELQGAALDLVKTQNATNLFSARLDTGLQAIGLRDDAARFRGSGVRASSRFDEKRIDEIVSQTLAERSRTRFGSFNNGRTIDTLTPEERQSVFESSVLRDTPDINRAGMVSFLARQRAGQQPGDANLGIQTRLQKQIDFVNSLSPKSDAEKSIADRRIIALTAGIKPEDLTDAQRGAAATSRENEARRLEAAESVAQNVRAESLTTLKSVDANMQELLKIAKTDGFAGVIRIVNEADDRARVSLGKRPNDRSTEAMTK